MSAATPARSPQSSEDGTPANPTPSDPAQNASQADRTVLEYLKFRGFSAAEKGFLHDLEHASTPDDKGKRPETSTISSEDFVKSIAVFAQKPSRPGENVMNVSGNVLHGLATMKNPVNIQNLIASIGSIGAEEILSLDPTDKQEGFRELEAWVDGSLDMYRVYPAPIANLICLLTLP
jgi:transcription initiation factor TFIID subunit 5